MLLGINHVSQSHLRGVGLDFTALPVQNAHQRFCTYDTYGQENRKSSSIHGKWIRMITDYVPNRTRMHNKWFGYARMCPQLREILGIETLYERLCTGTLSQTPT